MANRSIATSRFKIRNFGYSPLFAGGASTDRIAFTYLTTTYDLAGSWSVCAWIKAVSAGGNNAGRILDKSAAYLFFVGSGQTLSMTNGGSTKASPAGLFSLNEWVHVAATYDGSNVRMYVNGLLRYQVAQTTNPTVNSNNIQIGNAAGASNARAFDGYISEVLLFKDKALSQGEIMIIRNGWIDDETGLILYAKLNEASGAAIDYSSYANNGTVTGAVRTAVTNAPTPGRTSVISL